MTAADPSNGDKAWPCRLRERRRLTDRTFELVLSRPPGFDFKAGQRISLQIGQTARDYTLVNPPADNVLIVLVRRIPTGQMTPILDQLPIGADLRFAGPDGHFVHRPGRRPAVMAATGTGIAPFAAMIRDGARPAVLLHGVRTHDELYYREELQAAAHRYVPCLSREASLAAGAFQGYVTQFLKDCLAPTTCDFYLAGRMAMIHDALEIIDDSFPSARVFTEAFF